MTGADYALAGERPCRYAARPAIATERLSRLDDDRLLYQLKRRWRDGTTHIVLEPIEFVEKLAALIPPPRFHLVRYHGILAPCTGWCRYVVPACERDAAQHGCCRAVTNGEWP